jgi:hypothetical protein
VAPTNNHSLQNLKQPKSNSITLQTQQKTKIHFTKKKKKKKLDLLARGPLTPAFLRPFFLIIKLEPIKALETIASINPNKLLEYIYTYTYTYIHIYIDEKTK